MSMTLDDFRTHLQRALGNRGYDSDRLDLWINWAYIDLTGAVEFNVLFAENETTTVDGQNYLDVPDNTLSIVLIKDLTSDVLLGDIDKSEYYRRRVTDGPAKRYCWLGNKILLTPVPDDAYDFLIITETGVSPLSSDDESTILPDMWDIAILDLAVHYGLFNTGNEARSAAWLSRGISYIQSRMTEQDLKAKPGLAAMQEKLAGLSKNG